MVKERRRKVMRKLVVVAMAAFVALALAGCGGSASSSAASSASASGSSEAASSASSAAKDFDGTGFSDTGAGTMTLVTAGGTTEGGNVPQVAAKSTTSMMQIELDYDGGDGTVCTVYIDGMETEKMNAADRSQNTLNLQGDALTAGKHKVEMVAMDGSTPKIYKSAEYEVVI